MCEIIKMRLVKNLVIHYVKDILIIILPKFMTKLKVKLLPLVLFILISSCQKDRIHTGFHEIDEKYVFDRIFIGDSDTLDKKFKVYYSNTKQGYCYMVINESKERISRGWVFKDMRIGDWHYENIKNSETDSIINYVNQCGKQIKNTSKYFLNNKIQVHKGGYHEFEYNSESIKRNQPFDVVMKICYDKRLYEENLQLYFFKSNTRIYDYCDFLKMEKDSFSSYGEDVYNFRINPTDIGENSLHGYYLLLYKKKANMQEQDNFEAKAFFFRVDFNAEE